MDDNKWHIVRVYRVARSIQVTLDGVTISDTGTAISCNSRVVLVVLEYRSVSYFEFISQGILPVNLTEFKASSI